MANRLASEGSPYLRQHADNPVDWWPWGDEAFTEARRRDVPVLLSVGYSACHWCHVMAHESFEDPAIAARMNELFVNVKVDREERPDVDAVYMSAVQALTGQGGWPMTVFLAPDGRPFFGGTYFPSKPRGGMISFPELMERINELWLTRRDDLTEQAGALTEAISEATSVEPAGQLPGVEALAEASTQLLRSFDPTWGGFGSAPKFPQTMSLELLLRDHERTGSRDALDAVTTSLDAMASGGIYDHLGGGFARYSVDRQWLVPHFEKMLYDQALLARAYLHAWQVTREPRYLQVLTETVEYVLRELRHPSGGFYSAEDADSEGVEGRFYVWSLEELRDVAGEKGEDPEAAEAAVSWWDVTVTGNFEGDNILWRPQRGDLLRPDPVERARRRLFEHRAKRVRPGLDDKVLTEWNGLMLATLAEAASATGRKDWLEAAVANGEMLLDSLRRDDGRWLRSWQSDGGARHLAYAADHAAVLDGFLRLSEATGEARWVTEARSVAEAMIGLFWDDRSGGLFTTGIDAEALVTRPKDLFDNATPSASSLAAHGLIRLAAVTGELSLHDRAEQILRLLAGPAVRQPLGLANVLCALGMAQAGMTEIVVTGDRSDLLNVATQRYTPNAVLVWGERFDGPAWEGRDDGLAYVCRNFTCQAPTDSPEELAAQLVA